MLVEEEPLGGGGPVAWGVFFKLVLVYFLQFLVVSCCNIGFGTFSQESC